MIDWQVGEHGQKLFFSRGPKETLGSISSWRVHMERSKWIHLEEFIHEILEQK